MHPCSRAVQIESWFKYRNLFNTIPKFNPAKPDINPRLYFGESDNLPRWHWETSDTSLDEINSLLKGLLFAQEMFEDSSIEFFVARYPEKYGFIMGSMEDMPDYQETLFQGSTAEGLARFGIEEKDAERQYAFMRFERYF